MNNMNVIIADDHPIVLFGIRKSLEQIEWVNVVGEFEDSTALINNLPKLDAHVLITDLSMPGDKYGDGITLIKYIKRHFPSLSIIVLTMNNNPAILSAVLDLDIEGIVLKQGAPTDLPKALAALQKGKKFTPESVSRLLEKISAGGYGDKRLSPKESEVLRLFAEGFLVTEIAKKLNRSIKTISSQKKSAMMKLGVENDIALGSRTRLNIMGALNLKALTSPLICEYKTINEYNVSRFFNEIRKVYPDYNQKIHVILDGAGYHRSQLVKDWAEVVNIRLHYLPPYSPNLNPIERMWKLMNEHARNNRYFSSTREFREAISVFFNQTLPDIADSLTSRINDHFQVLTPAS